MNIKKGSMILLVASMVSISVLASEEVSATDQLVSADDQTVTKDAKDVIAQVATDNIASPSTIDQIRELISEWSTWAWKEGIQEHPYLSVGSGLTAVLLVYLLTNKIYRDAVIQENNNDAQHTKPKSCCRKKRQEEAVAAETTTAAEELAPASQVETEKGIARTAGEETSQPAPEVSSETAPVVVANEKAEAAEAAAAVEATETDRVLTSKEVCEEHGCACLVEGKCPCEKDERGSCSCCHKKMNELKENKQSRARWQKEATEAFLKKILIAMREYKAAINWAQ